MPETLTLQQGATFRKSWTLYEGNDIVKDIASITMGYPTVFTVTGHGLPAGPIPIALVNVGTRLNTASVNPDDRITAQKIDANTFSVDIDSSAFTAYTSGGKLVYTLPKDLTGYTAEAHLRKRVTSIESPLFTLTESDGIDLGGIEGTVTVEITDERSATVTFSKSVLQVELTSAGGETIRPIDIRFQLDKESTR